jgi:hypothetical protein
MDNVTTKLNGSTLTITVDISKRFGPSSSGKTDIVASTRGAIKVGDVSLALNVYTKANGGERRVSDSPIAAGFGYKGDTNPYRR